MKNKILTSILAIIIMLATILGLASCNAPETSEPVLNEELSNAHIIFLEYTIRYSTGSGNKEYIVIGYTLPDNNALQTMTIPVNNVIFVKENVAEIRYIKNGTVSNSNYLYINETKFLELLK